MLLFREVLGSCFDKKGFVYVAGCNGGVLWTRGLSILQLVVLEGRWDTVVQCVW